MPHFSSDAEVERLARAMLDRTLPKPAWTHAAHFAVAVWVLRHPHMLAERDIPPAIRAYNEATGVANTDSSGYHETITLASVRQARRWLADRTEQPLYIALNTLLESPLGRSDWLLQHWSKERLFSPAARRAWLEPDLQPLP